MTSLYFRPQQVNYSRLLKVCREHPRARELRLHPRDYHAVAMKDRPHDPAAEKPEGAGEDWTPPAQVIPDVLQIVTATAGVRVLADEKLQPGEVSVYP